MDYTPIEKIYKTYLQNKHISLDSRNIMPKESMFFAIKGPNFNANEFADESINKGASYAVVDDITINYKNKDKIIYVKDVLDSLTELAALHRNNIQAPIIAITGTSGKTTTKNLIAKILSTKYKVLATKGNLNSNIGLPVTILQIDKSHEIVVLEMGADKCGDIKRKCHIAKPTHGIITSIGKAHLETFGSLENIKRTKAELYDYLRDNGRAAFINSDDKILVNLSKEITKKIHYGQQLTPDNYVAGIAKFYNDKMQILWQHTKNSKPVLNTVNTNLIGDYNLINCLAAIAVAKYFDVDDNYINEALANYKSSDNRSEIIHTSRKNTIINDAYNANPLSMQSALKSFSNIEANSKIAIVGDMLELGKYSQQEHQKVIALINNLNIDKIFFIGAEFYKFNKIYPENNRQFFRNISDFKPQLNDIRDAYILLKASRGLQLETLIKYL